MEIFFFNIWLIILVNEKYPYCKLAVNFPLDFPDGYITTIKLSSSSKSIGSVSKGLYFDQ